VAGSNFLDRANLTPVPLGVPEPLGAAPDHAQGGARPNPSASAVVIETPLARDAPRELDRLELRIVDVTGRVVRTLTAADGALARRPGAVRWTWDGRDVAGRRVPQGSYYASVAAAGEKAAGEAVRIAILR
jgi:flagellar hook assembly protein FlgD